MTSQRPDRIRRPTVACLLILPLLAGCAGTCHELVQHDEPPECRPCQFLGYYTTNWAPIEYFGPVQMSTCQACCCGQTGADCDTACDWCGPNAGHECCSGGAWSEGRVSEVANPDPTMVPVPTTLPVPTNRPAPSTPASPMPEPELPLPAEVSAPAEGAVPPPAPAPQANGFKLPKVQTRDAGLIESFSGVTTARRSNRKPAQWTGYQRERTPEQDASEGPAANPPRRLPVRLPSK